LLTTLRKNYTTVVIVVLIAVLGGITYSRSLEWRSDVALWQANIRTEPTNGKGYQNLFAEALIAKDIGLAQTLLAEARSKAPAASNDYMEGMIYFMQYDNIPALKLFENAVRQDKNHIRSLLNIGIIYQEMGKMDKAVEYYNRTIRADAPDGWGCRENARKRLEVINTKQR
jgi:tetratricopeptide (TPR) repeat protein